MESRFCTLTEDELRHRRATVLAEIRRRQVGVVPLANGFGYLFEPDETILVLLQQVVELERQCCQSLSFRIVPGKGTGPLRLEITGPPEAETTIAEFFGRPAIEPGTPSPP